MTIDELRSYPNCGHYTDEQAMQIIHTLDKLAIILFDYTCHTTGIVIDNQIVMKVNQDETPVNIAA